MKNLLMIVLLLAVGACAERQSRDLLTRQQRQSLLAPVCADAHNRPASCSNLSPAPPLLPTASSAPVLPPLPATAVQGVNTR